MNFKVVMEAEGTGPDWLERISAFLEGKAAATFVVLAGVGVSLLTRKAQESGDPSDVRRARIRPARRGCGPPP